MNDVVLDASALLALLNAEKGAEVVADSLQGAVVSTVNLSEVVAKLNDFGMPEDEIYEVIESLGLEIQPFDKEQAYQTGLLRAKTKSFGISLGDRACLNLARMLGLTTLTADRNWTALDVGASIKVIR